MPQYACGRRRRAAPRSRARRRAAGRRLSRGRRDGPRLWRAARGFAPSGPRPGSARRLRPGGRVQRFLCYAPGHRPGAAPSSVSASATAFRRRSRRSATFLARPYFSASSSRSRCASSARAGVAGGHVPRLRRANAVAADDARDQLRLGLLAVGLALLFPSCRSAINLGSSAHVTLCATACATPRL